MFVCESNDGPLLQCASFVAGLTSNRYRIRCGCLLRITSSKRARPHSLPHHKTHPRITVRRMCAVCSVRFQCFLVFWLTVSFPARASSVSPLPTLCMNTSDVQHFVNSLAAKNNTTIHRVTHKAFIHNKHAHLTDTKTATAQNPRSVPSSSAAAAVCVKRADSVACIYIVYREVPA